MLGLGGVRVLNCGWDMFGGDELRIGGSLCSVGLTRYITA